MLALLANQMCSTGALQQFTVRRERDASARRAAFEEILSEVTNTVTRNGARGFQRSLQALQAALSVGNEYVANFRQGVPDPPQVLLMFTLASNSESVSQSAHPEVHIVGAIRWCCGSCLSA